MKKLILIMSLICLNLAFAQDEADELPAIEAGVDSEFQGEPSPAAAPVELTDASVLEVEPVTQTNVTAATAAEPQILNNQPINVDGYVKDAPVTDSELTQIKSEIDRQKKETVLNKEKARGFQELTKSVEVLSETTEAMLEEKREAKTQIAEYNTKVKCLQEENPGAECDKFVRRKR